MKIGLCEQVRVNWQTAAMCPSCVSRDHGIRFGSVVNRWRETACARTVYESNVFNFIETVRHEDNGLGNRCPECCSGGGMEKRRLSWLANASCSSAPAS